MTASGSVNISRSGRFRLSRGHGRLDASLSEPRAPRRAAVVLHGGGSTMNDGIVRGIAAALEERGSAVLRINFRGVGTSTGTFYADGGAGERADARAALDFLADRFPGLPLWLAGISFGAWVGLRVALADSRVTRLLGVALPIRIEQFDMSFLRRNKTKPLAVVQGENDEYGPRPEIEPFVAKVPAPKRLWIVDGAGHGFSRRRAGLEADVAKAIAWLARGERSSRR